MAETPPNLVARSQFPKSELDAYRKFRELDTALGWTNNGVVVAIADDEAIRQEIYTSERLAPAGSTLWSCDDLGALARVPTLAEQQRVLLVARTSDLETLRATQAWEIRRVVVDFREQKPEAIAEPPTRLHGIIEAAGDAVRNGCDEGEPSWVTWTLTWDGQHFVGEWSACDLSGEARAPTFELLLVAMAVAGEEDPRVELDAAGQRVVQP